MVESRIAMAQPAPSLRGALATKQSISALDRAARWIASLRSQ
jgi:hypothetical protein